MGVNAGESSSKSKRDADDAVVDEVKAETAALWLVVTGGGTAIDGAKFDEDVVRDDANDDAGAAGALAGVNASNCPKSAKNGSDVGAFREVADREGIGDVLPLAPSELKKSKSAVKLADEDEADGTAIEGTWPDGTGLARLLLVAERGAAAAATAGAAVAAGAAALAPGTYGVSARNFPYS